MKQPGLPTLEEQMKQSEENRKTARPARRDSDGPTYINFGRPERGIMYRKASRYYPNGEYTLYGEA
jgi:hypothetical protein